MCVAGSFTYYRNTLLYEGGSAVPTKIFHPEGFVAFSGTLTTPGEWTYKYYKTDHLGNVRALLAVDNETLVEEQHADYYPFGLVHDRFENLHLNRMLYSGKELQDAAIGTNGQLGWYDFGARHYDPFTGHWMTQDLLARDYSSISPYAFCLNNPILFIDLWGLSPVTRGEQGDGEPDIFDIPAVIIYPDNDSYKKSNIWMNSSYVRILLERLYNLRPADNPPPRDVINSLREGMPHPQPKPVRDRLSELGAHLFANEELAYKYMWNASHKNGYAYKEHAAYIFANGQVLLLPVINNQNTESLNYHRWLTQKNGQYRIVGYYSPVVGYTHTHPGSISLDVSNVDAAFFNSYSSLTFKIIANGGVIYQVWGDKSYKQVGIVL